MPEFLAVDIGTSFLKGAVLALDPPAIRHVERAPVTDFLPGLPAGFHETDPLALAAGVEALLDRLRARAANPAGLVMCNQMHGVVLVDGAGAPRSNFVCWLDQRVSAEEFAPLADAVTPAEREDLGNEFRPAIAASYLYWMARRGMLPDGAIPLSLGDFVAARLCGAPPSTEPTNAAASGAFHVRALGWHRGVIAKAGLERLAWPPVRRTGEAIGRWNGIPCYTPVGDAQCALAGALLAENELSVNIGTGSQVSVIAAAPEPGAHQTRPYFDGRFLKTITHIPAGRALARLVSLLTELNPLPEEEAWRRIERAVADVAETDLRASLTFFPGPCGDRGALENLRESNLSVGHLFRAAFESMARNYETCALRLDPARSWSGVVFSGGVARRLPLLREFIAARLAAPCRLSPHPEDTLLGLLVLAAAFSGGADSVRLASDRLRG